MFIDDINFFIDGSLPTNKNIELVNENLGYIRGNMFADEYIPYKNFKLKNLDPISREEELLIKISEAEFALNDLSLYLDLHPDNDFIYNKFKMYVKQYKTYLDEYERSYGPLNLCSSYSSKYEYYKNPWPWDNDGGVKYV